MSVRFASGMPATTAERTPLGLARRATRHVLRRIAPLRAGPPRAPRNQRDAADLLSVIDEPPAAPDEAAPLSIHFALPLLRTHRTGQRVACKGRSEELLRSQG
jgi:hypothetical protein